MLTGTMEMDCTRTAAVRERAAERGAVIEPAARLLLVRHGETEWSRDGRHTSTTDVALTAAGRAAAEGLAPALAAWRFSTVLSSPRRRARETASLALPGARVEVIEDLAEWDYGEYEGLTTQAIRRERDPAWDLWREGCPGGESPAQVGARADRAMAAATRAGGDAACFAHGHVQPEGGALLALDTASLSVLGHEHGRRVLSLWNARAARTA